MSEEKRRSKRDELVELQSIRNLLIISLLKSGATSKEIDIATGMGAGNIRAKFAGLKKRKGQELE
jgi:hypothetical protein